MRADVTRRSLLRRAMLLLGIGSQGLMACASRRPAGAGDPQAGRALGAPARTARLSAAELESLVAFGEVLLEGRTLPPPERGYLVGFIEERTAGSAAYLSLYRMTAGTLDHLAGRPFASLPLGERGAMVERYGLAAWQAPPAGDPSPLSAEVLALRTRAVPDLIRGYYASPAGWAVVGYDSFPGRCGDPTRYTRPEGQRP